VIAVVGPGDEQAVGPAVLAAAARVGELLAVAGHQVVTGGLGGVMAAAARGVTAAGGTAVALLPGDDPAAAHADAGVVVATGLGEGRNVLVVRSATAVIAVGGSWGTLGEVALARRIGRPVVWLHGWSVDGPDDPVATAASAEDAVAFVLAPPG
jgi:uncharacterized protein (TIGR00725 family)